jgi:hypothetical protein
MGRLIYAGTTSYDIDDRMLAHLRAAAMVKLRRRESFMLSWVIDLSAGSGRVSLWVSPAIPLEFVFSGSRALRLDETWVRVMVELSNTPRGLVLIPQEEAAQVAAGAPVPAI